MIANFKHKGLKRLFERDDPSQVNPDHVRKLRHILMALVHANRVEDMGLPAFGLHSLKGDLRDYWAVKVSGNWRVIFRFEDGDALDVDYLDYH